MNIIKNILSLINREVPIEILKKRGLKVGKNFTKQQGCFIDPTHCFLIEIGNNVTFSIRVTLLAHDASSKKIINKAVFNKIIIEDNVFVGANVTILPGITIGKNSIIGAGSVVTKNVPANTVYAGNPAKQISTLEQYCKKIKRQCNNYNSFDKSYKMNKTLDKRKMEELVKAIDKYGVGFIE